MFVLFSRTSFHKFGKCIFNPSCKLTFIVRRIQVFLDMALYHWVSGSQCFKEHLCLQQSAHHCDDTPAVQQAVRHTIVTLHHHPVGCTSQYCDGITTAQLAVYHIIVTLCQHPVSFISHYCDGITTTPLAAYHTVVMVHLPSSWMHITLLTIQPLSSWLGIILRWYTH